LEKKFTSRGGGGHKRSKNASEIYPFLKGAFPQAESLANSSFGFASFW